MARLQLTRQQTMRTVSVFALLACMPLYASAQSGMSRAEAAQLYTAAGFAIANDQPVNRCGQRAKPRVSFIDLDADKRPEALFVDEDAPATCRRAAILRCWPRGAAVGAR